jgi:putative membrane protein
MKSLLRSFVVHSIVLWIVATYVGGISFNNDLKILLLGALSLTLVDALIKPLINILLLPFNLVTLGTFRWVSSVITLYMATLIVPGFAVNAFRYSGLMTAFFIIPPFTLSVLGAYILIAILVSIFVSILFWLIH